MDAIIDVINYIIIDIIMVNLLYILTRKHQIKKHYLILTYTSVSIKIKF